MNIDAESFWRRLDEGLLNKGVSLRKMCQDTHYTYKGVINQRSAKIIPPKINQLVDFSSYLDMPLGYLILGKTPSSRYTRIQDIIDWLMAKSDAELDVFRQYNHVPREKEQSSSSRQEA